jgi:hypothetical protein
MIGRWRGMGNAAITLQPGHQFIASNLDLDLHDAPGRWSGRGSWSLYKKAPDSPDLEISIGPDEKEVVEFIVGYEHNGWVIFFYLGDPDEDHRYILRKVNG